MRCVFSPKAKFGETNPNFSRSYSKYLVAYAPPRSKWIRQWIGLDPAHQEGSPLYRGPEDRDGVFRPRLCARGLAETRLAGVAAFEQTAPLFRACAAPASGGGRSWGGFLHRPAAGRRPEGRADTQRQNAAV